MEIDAYTSSTSFLSAETPYVGVSGLFELLSFEYLSYLNTSFHFIISQDEKVFRIFH